MRSLKPTLGQLNDKGKLQLLILLDGTIPIKYKGQYYNIPIRLYFPDYYPRFPIIVYIVPTSNMRLKYPCKLLATDGRVKCRYLDK